LKRREKQRAKEAAKASKAAAAPPPAAKEKGEAKPSEEELNPNVRSHILCYDSF
jgi:lysyl-tRNA synthetase class 2